MVSTEVIELKTGSSEYSEDSQKSQKVPKGEYMALNYESEVREEKPQVTNSEFRKHSQDSRAEAAVKTFEFKFEEKPTEKQTLLSGSEFREHSRESRTSPCIEITEHEDLKEITLPLKPKQLQQLQMNDTYCREVVKSYIKMWSYRKNSLRKQEYCTDYGVRMEELSNACWSHKFCRIS